MRSRVTHPQSRLMPVLRTIAYHGISVVIVTYVLAVIIRFWQIAAALGILTFSSRDTLLNLFLITPAKSFVTAHPLVAVGAIAIVVMLFVLRAWAETVQVKRPIAKRGLRELAPAAMDIHARARSNAVKMPYLQDEQNDEPVFIPALAIVRPTASTSSRRSSIGSVGYSPAPARRPRRVTEEPDLELLDIEVISSIAWEPSGRALAVASESGVVRIWDATHLTLVSTPYIINVPKGPTCLSWSPSGVALAYGLSDSTIRLWNANLHSTEATLAGHTAAVSDVTWSPDGSHLASVSTDKTVRIWNVATYETEHVISAHQQAVTCVAWSPDGTIVASGAKDGTLRLSDPLTGMPISMLNGHTDSVNAIAWSRDGASFATGSDDRTIRIWDPMIGRETRRLEGHTGGIVSLDFSTDGRALATQAISEYDQSRCELGIWRTDTWQLTDALLPIKHRVRSLISRSDWTDAWTLTAPTDGIYSRTIVNGSRGVTFCPGALRLTTFNERWPRYSLLEIDSNKLTNPTKVAVQYSNAKVVLLGDSGVGKSGLGLVLTGKPFEATESTHGRHVWTLEERRVAISEQQQEVRELVLWDLAGQPGYRLIHQLHLHEVTLALVIFDSRSETDPLAGVYYWDRALRQARTVEGRLETPLTKFLVAARIDRGGLPVSAARAHAVTRDLGFARYFETSAKQGTNISALAKAVKASIDWDQLPKVSSTDLLQAIRGFLLDLKKHGLRLLSLNKLYTRLVETSVIPPEILRTIGEGDLRSQFETCLVLLESSGFVRRLSFGDLVLLQPELLDAYASALVNAVRGEPDGLGSILEESAKNGDFPVPSEDRLEDKSEERLLLIAMIEDLIRRDLAIREDTESGAFLVLPSQSTRANPTLPDPPGKEVTFSFEGPILNIYSTLAVRLSHSMLFRIKDVWHNAVTFHALAGGECGFFLQHFGEGEAKLSVFFADNASDETKFYFETYVETHLCRSTGLPTIPSARVVRCPQCHVLISEQVVEARRARGFTFLVCPVCGAEVSLLQRAERLSKPLESRVSEMDQTAEAYREAAARDIVLAGKREANAFDVFLCYNHKDKRAVHAVGDQLKAFGVLPWLDDWEMPPGTAFAKVLGEQIHRIRSAAVFIGPSGIGPWQDLEILGFLNQLAKRGCPIIPVILPGGAEPTEAPFIEILKMVDFRQTEPNPLVQLVWGVTGERPENVVMPATLRRAPDTRKLDIQPSLTGPSGDAAANKASGETESAVESITRMPPLTRPLPPPD